MTFRTRFAPSPTGPLHLGHAYSAILAHDMARADDGEFVLRIEDIDQSRARPEWEQQIYDDLEWLGLGWNTPVRRQSDQMAAYTSVIDVLLDGGYLYPCTCNRRDIQAALSAPQEGSVTYGPDGPVYPGTCRTLARPLQNAALRLDILMACAGLSEPLEITETGQGPQNETGKIRFDVNALMHSLGDIVLARKDMGTSYHLSVVIDDALQGITHVVRGQDLFEATKIHVVLQHLLSLPTPVYHHHKLIRDDAGKRLAKRDDARAIAKYRADGYTPADIRKMVGL